MASLTEHTHHLKIRSTQMEMHSPDRSDRTEDYDRKLKDAQEELERIQEQREELERKKHELEELTNRKHEFVAQQVELTEKFTSALTLIDRTLLELRGEAEDIEQCRVCFAAHLDKIQKFNPDNWTRDNLSEKLERAAMAIDVAEDEFDQAAAHFEGTRSGAIFGRSAKRGRTHKASGVASEFMSNLRNGFAFNLPMLVIGSVWLVVYLLKR
jgi:Asp-tRNA(Asn)/Glu-tRNA(Gln) amidotransferase B subunit